MLLDPLGNPILPTLPTKLPTEMKNELMLALTKGKYNWDGLIDNPAKPTFEETMILMDAGEDGRDILLCYKRMVCKRVAESALRSITKGIANSIARNNIENLRATGDLETEEYDVAVGMLENDVLEEEPFVKQYTTRKLREKADEYDAIVKRIGELELERGSPFTQEQADE